MASPDIEHKIEDFVIRHYPADKYMEENIIISSTQGPPYESLWMTMSQASELKSILEHIFEQLKNTVSSLRE